MHKKSRVYGIFYAIDFLYFRCTIKTEKNPPRSESMTKQSLRNVLYDVVVFLGTGAILCIAIPYQSLEFRLENLVEWFHDRFAVPRTSPRT